ncbi:MAG: Asp-tRNA(Asn)/Glu-tRNA(Gln) amidotransferase GatCAB subunit C [Ignavibacteriales bacterium CG_4_9_14_3_um_filter_30_11]|nr:MAG: Asp-tRNA(Asn)/Glu-tRNA(Gln) amidotransferase GatCAB subunit C [Ignavibacteriales bacterium CG_4_9_14_3_um_filter_30_11]
MSISKEQVKHIAKLARLKLNDEELESYTKELSSILDYIEKLNELDTANVEPLTHPIENNNVFREDELEDSVSREDALKNAPKEDGKYFKVPKVIKSNK